MHGITERVARANGWHGPMRELPLERAREIGKTQYWDQLNLDLIAPHSTLIAGEMFDTLYNGGDPGRWLQRALNLFNRQQKDYLDVKVDGRIGPITAQALKAFIAKRGNLGERLIYNTLNGLQMNNFIRIAEADPEQEEFTVGWISNRAHFL